jgi:hypothetical protein
MKLGTHMPDGQRRKGVRVSGIIFTRHAHSQKTGKAKNSHVFGASGNVTFRIHSIPDFIFSFLLNSLE